MSIPNNILGRSGFNLDAAVFLAEASQAAYDDANSTEEWSLRNEFTKTKFFENEETQGFWCIADNRIALLVFRGTSSPWDWIRDARFFPAPHPWGLVHIGFRNGVEEINSALQEFATLAKNIKQVWITGHSLGGALALIAAAKLKMQGIVTTVYTYGQPRVGLSDFAERFNLELPGQLYRFINQSDIVTRVPTLLYRHTGIPKRIVRPGVLESVQNLELPESPQINALNRIIGTPAAKISISLEAAISPLASPILMDIDAAPLTESEFIELQGALDNTTLEGAIPFFGDHAIANYIELIKEIRDMNKIN